MAVGIWHGTIGSSKLKSILTIIILLGAFGLHAGMIVYFGLTQDDAYITFRYAENYLNDHELVFNPGERVEGYTNFFWTILMIIGGRLGIHYVYFSKIIGALCGIGVIGVTYLLSLRLLPDLSHKRIVASLAALAVGTNYSFAYWAGAGLETAAFALCVIGAIYAYLRRSHLLAVALILSTLMRPEGGLLIVFLLMAELINPGRQWSFLFSILVLPVIFLMPFAMFKLVYYGALLPNPFYAKTSFAWPQLVNGADYLLRYLTHYWGYGVLLFPVIIAFGRMNRAQKIVTMFAAIYMVYIVLIGGDVLKVHRFFVPIIALLAIVFISSIALINQRILLVYSAILAVMIWQSIAPRDFVWAFHQNEIGLVSKMQKLMKNLTAVDSDNFTLAATTIGVVAYELPGRTVIDMLGLTDTTIARHPLFLDEDVSSTWRETKYNAEYILSRQPKYILFSTGFRPSAPAEKALFRYSEFLRNYRTIAFYFSGAAHPIYQRMGDVELSRIKADVSPQFEEFFAAGIHTLNSGDPRAALALFDSARVYCPLPDYPYLHSYRSQAYGRLGELDECKNELQLMVAADDRAFEGYLNLCLFEYQFGSHEAAMRYYEKTIERIPWYRDRIGRKIGLIQ